MASSYGLHIIGFDKEPETHDILHHIFHSTSNQSFFINVGANIGAFLIDLCRYEHIHCICFEPSANCVYAINKSVEINFQKNVVIEQCLVGNSNNSFPYSDGVNPQGSSIYSAVSESSSELVQMCRLDDCARINSISPEAQVVLMIDVERYVLEVIRGGLDFIRRIRPLIIFEYNQISKSHYKINEVCEVLGNSYDFFRLKTGGGLDKNLENAWNCIALPSGGFFEEILSSRISC